MAVLFLHSLLFLIFKIDFLSLITEFIDGNSSAASGSRVNVLSEFLSDISMADRFEIGLHRIDFIWLTCGLSEDWLQ